MHGVEAAQRLARALEQVAGVGLGGGEATHVHLRGVDGRRALVDPARQRKADSRAEDDALRVHAGGDEQSGYLACLAEDEVAVRREALRRAQVVREARVRQRRDALGGGGQRPAEVLHVRLELAEREVLRDRRGRAGAPVGLERTDEEAAAVVAHVDRAVQVADDRQVAGGSLDRLRLRPVVLRRVQRDARAGEQREVARPQPGGEDDCLALHVAVVGLDRRHARRAGGCGLQPEAGHSHAFEHAHAEGPGGLGRRPGRPPRVHRGVLLEEHAAGQAVHAEDAARRRAISSSESSRAGRPWWRASVSE